MTSFNVVIESPDIGKILLNEGNIVELSTIEEGNLGIPSIELSFVIINPNDFAIVMDKNVNITLTVDNSKQKKSFYYKSTYHRVQDQSGDKYVVAMRGIVSIRDFLFTSNIRSFSDKKSTDVLASVLSECDYLYKSEAKSDDSQSWIQYNNSNIEFIKELIERSYISEEDFLLPFISASGNIVIDTYETLISKPKKMDILGRIYSSLIFENGDESSDVDYGQGTKLLEFILNTDKRIPQDVDYDESVNSTKNKVHASSRTIFDYQLNYGNTHIHFNRTYLMNKVFLNEFNNNTVILSFNDDFLIDTGLSEVVDFDPTRDNKHAPKLLKGLYLLSGIFFHYKSGKKSTTILLNRKNYE